MEAGCARPCVWSRGEGGSAGDSLRGPDQDHAGGGPGVGQPGGATAGSWFRVPDEELVPGRLVARCPGAGRWSGQLLLP
eukprot:15481222-Alexandrium_andersonii.AAC.1